MSNRPLSLLCYLLAAMLLAGCSAKRPMRVHTLSNYNADAPHQILFLDFTLSKPNPDKPEQVELTNAIVGNGEMKKMSQPANSAYQIKLLRHYKGNQPVQWQLLDHPLYRQVEVASEDGTLERRETNTQTAPLSVRFQYTSDLERIELYSIEPNRHERKIYTLPIKP